MKIPDPRDLQAIGIDFGGTSVKIGALPDILTDGGEEPVVLETAAYGSVDDLIGAIATSVTDSGLAAGTYSYSLFCTYDEKDGRPGGTPDSDERVSSSVKRQSISVS